MARAPEVRFGFFFGIRLLLSGRGGLLGERDAHVEGKDCVAAFGCAVLHDIFPLFLVVVFLGLGPRVAGGEVDSLRVGGPGKGMHFLLPLSQRMASPPVGEIR